MIITSTIRPSHQQYLCIFFLPNHSGKMKQQTAKTEQTMLTLSEKDTHKSNMKPDITMLNFDKDKREFKSAQRDWRQKDQFHRSHEDALLKYPFKCSSCKRTFSHLWRLRQHRTVHSIDN